MLSVVSVSAFELDLFEWDPLCDPSGDPFLYPLYDSPSSP